MKAKTIILSVVLVCIIGLIVYFEATTVRVENVNSQIAISENAIERIVSKSSQLDRANELVQPNGYINTEYINISQYIGEKVVLVDFWTYSCINCQRTFPYLNAWHDKYESEGLVIIGVHTPEFEFEKKYGNVLSATEKYNITYPVVLDNNKQTWSAYKNRFWPRKYLIDIDGFIVYDHIGEGAYEQTEKEIQRLLLERSIVLNETTSFDTSTAAFESDKGIREGRTPELYFGYDFERDQLGNNVSLIRNSVNELNSSAPYTKDLYFLNGSWEYNRDHVDLRSEGQIYLNFFAKNVNIVAGSNEPVTLEVFIDGEKYSEIIVSDFDLYNVYSGSQSENHLLELRSTSGLMVYSFTFG